MGSFGGFLQRFRFEELRAGFGIERLGLGFRGYASIRI